MQRTRSAESNKRSYGWCCSWVVFFVVFCFSFGSKVCEAPRARKAVDRGVASGPDFTPGTVAQYEKGAQNLREFVEGLGWDLERLADQHPKVFNEILRDFASEALDQDKTRGETTAAILHFKEKYWWTRQQLMPVWRLLKMWQLREPIEMRHPASVDQTQALISGALSWDWWRVALLIWIAYHCLLRPIGFLNLRWQDIRILESFNVAVVVILKPKTRHTAARRQHVIVDDPFLFQVLSVFKEKCLPGGLVGQLSYNQFYRRLAALLQALGIPQLLSPFSFRAGGATQHWLTVRDFQSLRLRGRWVIVRSLEHYIQECISSLQEEDLAFEVRQKIRELARLAKGQWQSFLSRR